MLLQLLVSIQFQVCFTPLIGVLFTFPSRYLFTIGHRVVLRLGGWSPHIQAGFHVSRPTQEFSKNLPIRGYHPLWLTFPSYSGFFYNSYWPGPLSLVTTNGVSVDVLSSSYLDISVRWGCLPSGINLLVLVSPVGNLRIKAYSQLPTAYRSVSRPSSPLCAKASTKCSYRHLIGPYMKAEIGQTDQIFQLCTI